MAEQARSSSAYEPRPNPQTQDSYTHLRDRRQSTWEKGHRRKHSPSVEWHKIWTEDSWKQGRVLLIDYVAQSHRGDGRQKIVAQEFSDIDGLRKYYRNDNLSQQAALRVIHVQNASWATRFLLRKFNIDAQDDLVGTNFGRWARYEKPQRRGGKPVLNGKTFRSQRDPWRGISRTSFGCDYLRQYEKGKIADSNTSGGMRMMELNHYDALDQPAYGFDVYVQRLSVYVQFSDGEPALPVDPDIRNPYNVEERDGYDRSKRPYGSMDANGQKRYIPKLETLDNGSTIILFEHAQSGLMNDTLVGAREELEQRWRRLTFYMPRDETDRDDKLAVECMDFILRDIFKALAFNWEKYINVCEIHTEILEDKIYDNPADESRAPELWTNSSLWLKVERLMYLHTDMIKEMRNHLRELVGNDPAEDQPWLGTAAEEFDKLTTQFQEGVVKPTTNLSDLMYKSVGIRDARHSLQLGLSMWRLSWITFVFLPLTFTCGFFGMNVSLFENNPSIKWWFVCTVPLIALMFAGWYIIKHVLASQRQDPLRRGVYESLYHDLSQDHPRFWTRSGPKEKVVPVGWWQGIKWRLLVKWFNPERTLASKGYDAGIGELGAWSRTKRYLVQRWLTQMDALPDNLVPIAAPSSETDIEAASGNGKSEFTAVEELVGVMTPVAIAEADPTAASRLRKRLPVERLRSLSPGRSGERPGSAASEGGSGVMVEEKGVSEDERSEGEDGGKTSREGERERTFAERLNVPLYPGGAGIVARRL